VNVFIARPARSAAEVDVLVASWLPRRVTRPVPSSSFARLQVQRCASCAGHGRVITSRRLSRLGEPMTQSGEPAFDKREQLEQIRSGLMDGEQIYAVYDATGAGTGFIAATDKRVILQDKSFA
jgi:hypothetical protein